MFNAHAHQLYHPSEPFKCVLDFVTQLEHQIQILMANNLIARTVVGVNNVLEVALDQHQKNETEASNDLSLQCKAHLQFIDNVLYNEIDSCLVTEPMYLWNRGKLAGRGHKFGIYQYDNLYLEHPYYFVKATTPYDGNFSMLPELKKLANDFYKKINELSKDIDRTDENSPDFLIASWANEHDLEKIINLQPIINISNVPSTQQQTISTHNWQNHYAGYALIACTVGVAVAASSGMALKHFIEKDELVLGEDPTFVQQISFLGCLVGGVSTIIGTLTLAGSNKTMGEITSDAFEIASDALEVITPSAATMNAFLTRWGITVNPEFLNHHQERNQRDRHANNRLQ
ncbi:MAG: hypothetical protein ACHQAX_07350 [Gammaproteobacteria bacterium]